MGNRSVPGPTDAVFLFPAFWQDSVSMRVELNTVAPLMPPFVFFAGITEENMAGQLFAKVEGSRTLRLVFCAVEL